MSDNITELRAELEALLNKLPLKSPSNTPAAILADYLMSCLVAYNEATTMRDRYFDPEIGKMLNMDYLKDD